DRIAENRVKVIINPSTYKQLLFPYIIYHSRFQSKRNLLPREKKLNGRLNQNPFHIEFFLCVRIRFRIAVFLLGSWLLRRCCWCRLRIAWSLVITWFVIVL